jgi:hypothetical protein
MENLIEKLRCFIRDIAMLMTRKLDFYEKYEVTTTQETLIISESTTFFPRGQNSTVFINQGDTDFTVNGILIQKFVAGTPADFLAFSQANPLTLDITNYNIQTSGTVGTNPNLLVLYNLVKFTPKTETELKKHLNFNKELLWNIAAKDNTLKTEK